MFNGPHGQRAEGINGSLLNGQGGRGAPPQAILGQIRLLYTPRVAS
jgi:hypothetical protein